MQNDILGALSRVSDTDLTARMETLIKQEREATAELIAHLAELDTRDLHLREGYPSLYLYCRALGLSEWEAYNRIEVARTARRFPVILEMLAAGSTHLTAIRMLTPHLTPANHREVLESARGKSKAEVQAIVAELSPQPDVPFSVRRLPALSESRREPTGPRLALADGQLEVRALTTTASEGAATPAPTLPAGDSLAAVRLPVPDEARASTALALTTSPDSRGCATPLAPDRYKLQLTISGETLEKLRLAQDMLGHAVPSGDAAVVIDRALTALLAQLAKKKFADTARPRAESERAEPSPAAPVKEAAPRRVPASVKRVVWVRDLARCAFVGATGHRCDERRFVEFHHVDPHALGGEATADNIQLRCRRHNDYEGRLYFGGRRTTRGARGRSELVPEQVGLRASHSTLETSTPPAPDGAAR